MTQRDISFTLNSLLKSTVIKLDHYIFINKNVFPSIIKISIAHWRMIIVFEISPNVFVSICLSMYIMYILPGVCACHTAVHI